MQTNTFLDVNYQLNTMTPLDIHIAVFHRNALSYPFCFIDLVETCLKLVHHLLGDIPFLFVSFFLYPSPYCQACVSKMRHDWNDTVDGLNLKHRGRG